MCGFLAREPIYIVGFPKSGNTWCARLLSEYLQSNIFVQKENPIDSLLNRPDKEKAKFIIQKEHRLSRIPDNVKVVYILRDIRDVVVSGFFHNNPSFRSAEIKNNFILRAYFNREIVRLSKRWGGSGKKELRVFLESLLLSRKTERMSWNAHVEKGKSISGATIVRYEDLLENTFETMLFIIRSLGIERRDSELLKVIEAQSFSSLKKTLQQKGDYANVNFMRRGIAEDWKNWIPLKQLKKIEEENKDVLKSFGYRLYTTW